MLQNYICYRSIKSKFQLFNIPLFSPDNVTIIYYWLFQKIAQSLRHDNVNRKFADDADKKHECFGAELTSM